MSVIGTLKKAGRFSPLLVDYDTLSRLPSPEGIHSEQTPPFIECVEPATPPSKREANATGQ